MNASIKQLLKKMDRAVREHPRGDLLLGWRIRLWGAMKTEFRRQANFRRNVLAFLTAQEAYEVWRNGRLISSKPEEALEQHSELPLLVMDECARFLKGKSNRRRILEISTQLSDSLGYWRGRPHTPMEGAHCVIGAFANRILGVDDDVYEDRGWHQLVHQSQAQMESISDDSLGERDECEPYYFAANMSASGRGKRAEKLNAYWRHWLKKQVPLVIGPLPEVKALVKAWKTTSPPFNEDAGSSLRLQLEIPAGCEEEALRQHLQALAMTPKGQGEFYIHACQICGLTMSVGTWANTRTMVSYLAKQKASRRRQLARILELVHDVENDGEVNCYDYVFTAKDARWKEMRRIARELLTAYGWPQKRPAKQSEFLFGRAVP